MLQLDLFMTRNPVKLNRNPLTNGRLSIEGDELCSELSSVIVRHMSPRPPLNLWIGGVQR